jgi:hypothetical protein
MEMGVFPRINLHQLYSLNIYDGLDILFENLDMINLDELEKIIHTQSYDYIEIIPNVLSINTVLKTITLVGNKVNDTLYILSKKGEGDIYKIEYNYPKEMIITAVDYLYHIYKNNT